MIKNWQCLAMLSLLVALVACTPKQAAVALAPTPQLASPTPELPTAPSLSREDVAWSHIVEAAKKEGKVTAYGDTFTGEIRQAVADAFFEKYGIRAEMITGPGSVLTERIRTEQRMKEAVADVALISPASVVLLLQEGRLVPLAKELPVLREDAWLVPLLMDDGGHLLRSYASFQSPWINTDIVKPEEAPKSWADLLNPRWRGKLLINDPRTTAVADRNVYTLTKYKIVEPDFFPKLAAQKLAIPAGVGMGPPYLALAKGEGAILIFGVDSSGAPIAKEGGHIKPTVFTGGVTGISSAFQLIKNAPHPNAGKLFINFLLSQQGYELVTTIGQKGSFRKDVPDRSVMASLRPFNVMTNTIEDEIQINKNVRDGVAAKALGVQ